MKVWISTISTSKFSGINTLWAAMMRENFIPDRIHLINLTTKDKKNKARETTLKGYHSLLQRYGAKGKPVVHDVVGDDFSGLAKELESIVRKEKLKGHTVAIDMTPGRKVMSAFAMYMGVGTQLEYRADRIYYFFLDDPEGFYGKQPFPLLPSNAVTLYDLKKEVLGK